MKKLIIFILLFLFSFQVYSQSVGVIRIEGYVKPIFVLDSTSQEYIFSLSGALNDTISYFKIKTNTKSDFIISLQSKNNFNLSFNEEKWPYTLFLKTENILVEANGLPINLKNEYEFSLIINYKSYEDLNLFSGTYTDILKITIINF